MSFHFIFVKYWTNALFMYKYQIKPNQSNANKLSVVCKFYTLDQYVLYEANFYFSFC